MSNHILLVVGKPSEGKSHALQHFRNPETVGYLNCDRKNLPFNAKKTKFLANITVSDPEDILEYVDAFEEKEELKIGVIDTITDLMKTFKIDTIDEAADTRTAWGNYQKFYNKLISRLKNSSKTWVILAHVEHHFDETKEEDVSNLVLQGGASKAPISDFTVVVEADSRTISGKIKKVQNDYFQISPIEKIKGIKYYFVTMRTKSHPGTLARSADDMYDISETLIDNNVQHVLDIMDEYYNNDEY